MERYRKYDINQGEGKNCKVKKVPNCYSKSKYVYVDPDTKR